jgi:hypothetical protein
MLENSTKMVGHRGSQWVKALKMECRRMDWAYEERINLDKSSDRLKLFASHVDLSSG